MQDKFDERDEFWDLAKLVPKKKENILPFSTKSQVAEYVIPGAGEEKNAENTKISFEKYKSDASFEERSYIPENYPLIKQVTVKKFNDKYDFYDSFRKAAEIYFDYKTEKCEFAAFYSYMPQYSQLTREQKNYYFYWRDRVRHGKFIKSDYSYIYLFVYEILNLPEKIPPEEGIILLCKLWKEYRTELRRIDPYFAIWGQDYCLVYNLKCPTEIICEFIFDVIEVSNFKEFYLSDTEKAMVFGVDSLVAYLSDYDWRRGKYVEGEHSELYKKHMRAAMGRVISAVFLNGLPSGGETASITRDAFPRSLCTHTVKCKLTVEYYPMARDVLLREIFTGSVRYTENKLRALIGIKSRLAVRDLDDKYKRIIDGYFDELFASVSKKRTVINVPEYEKMYDAPGEKFSSAGADEIEKLSWSTTLRLVSEDELGEISKEKIEQTSALPEKPEEESSVDRYGLSDGDIEKIRLATTDGFLDDAAAERINEAFADGFGDVILEFCDTAYVLIEDYREEICEWLKQMK